MDYKQLLMPIEEGNPAGSYLKGERAQYRALRNTFNAAQSSFRRLIETPESSSDEVLFEENQKNWQAVSDACWQTLTEKSKDVEIYCWWVMSLVFQADSVNKVAQSLQTLTPFIETFWPDINPYLPDNKLKSTEAADQAAERAELQLRPLVQLLGESEGSGLLYMPLQMISLVGEIDHSRYLSAVKSQNLPELVEQAQKAFPSCQNEITDTVKALALAIESVDNLDAWIKKTSSDLSLPVISTQFLKTNLSDCLNAIEYLVKDSFAQWPLDKPAEQEQQTEQAQPVESVAPPSTSPQTPVTVGTEAQAAAVSQPVIVNAQTMSLNTTTQVSNRDQAFHELRKIAEFFAKTEPHSPVSFLLEKAIRWGYMSLPELMQEMVSGNDQVMGHVNLITGMNDDKAELPESRTTAPMSDIHSTGAKVSTITENASKSTPSETLTPSGSVEPAEPQAATEAVENTSSVDFEW